MIFCFISSVIVKRGIRNRFCIWCISRCCVVTRTMLLDVLVVVFVVSPAVRSKIRPKLIFASCVCVTPIARILGVSSLRI